MIRWTFLAVLIAVVGALAYLHATGKLDLQAEIDRATKNATDLTANFTQDEAQAAQNDAHDTPRAAIAPAVSVAAASERSFTETVMVTGSLVAREEILIAPEVEGLRILTLDVEAGDTVVEGQLLATLESATLTAKIAQTQANLQRADAAIAQAHSAIAQAEAALEEAEAQLARAEPLRKNNYLSETVYDQRRAAARNARAQFSTAKDGVRIAEAEKAQINAQLRELTWNLSRTEIRARTSGLITRRTARIGDVVSVAKPAMFVLARDGEIELNANVTEPKIARISDGQKAEIEIAGIDPVAGEVRLVSPEIDPTTRLGSVRIFIGSGTHLKIGAFGRATVTVATSRGLSVPASAILFEEGKAFVQMVKDGKVETAPVVRGLTSRGEIEIKSGLNDGDLVVAKAGTFLRNGDAVRAVTEPSQVSEAR